MTQNDRGAGVLVARDELIVELEDELFLIERARSIRMHDEVRDGLIGEEIGRAFDLKETLDA